MPARQRTSHYAHLALAALFLLGAILRLYQITGQVFVDDEWHGMYFAIGKTLRHTLTHVAIPGATCIPLNVYRLLLLRTVGWNETLLRLPSLAAGVLSLVVLPLLFTRLLGAKRVPAFAGLLAISPFLVFYSRMCRPYSAVALLAPAAVLSACLWMQNGKRRYGLLYALSGAGAIYFHIFAAPAVLAPLLGYVFRWRHHTGRDFRKLLGFSAIMGILLCLLLMPALLDSVRTTMPSLMRADAIVPATVTGFAILLSGTPNPVLTILFLALSLWGLVALLLRDRQVALTFASVPILYAVALLLSAPHGMHSPIVISRYLVAVFPLSYVLVALGVDEFIHFTERRTNRPSSGMIYALFSLCFPAALFVAGPLVHLYAQGGNFTNHIAFQQTYEPLAWNESCTRDMTPAGFDIDLTVSHNEISPFFDQLARDPGVKAIIEYPMLVGDHFNPHYFYQHFHRKRVLVGYVTDFPMRETPAAERHVYGNTYVDEILSLISDKRKLKFTNMIDMDDIDAIRRGPAGYVVIHKRFEAQLGLIYGQTPFLQRLRGKYGKVFGPPVYEDSQVVVFGVDRGKPTSP